MEVGKLRLKNGLKIMILFIIIIEILFTYPESALYYPFPSSNETTDYSGNENDASQDTINEIEDGYVDLETNAEPIISEDNIITGLNEPKGIPISINLWFQPKTLDEQVIIYKGKNNQYWALGINSDGKIYGKEVNQDKVIEVIADQNLLIDTWYYVVFTIEAVDNKNDELTIYLYKKDDPEDSIMVFVENATKVNIVTNNEGSDQLVIGTTSSSILLDELRIFGGDTVLTPDQVTEIATQTEPGEDIYMPSDDGGFVDISDNLLTVATELNQSEDDLGYTDSTIIKNNETYTITASSIVLYIKKNISTVDKIYTIKYKKDGVQSEEILNFDENDIASHLNVGLGEYIYQLYEDGIASGDPYTVIIMLQSTLEINSVWDTISTNEGKDYDMTLDGEKLYAKINLTNESDIENIMLFEYRIYINDIPEDWKIGTKSLNIEENKILVDNNTYKIGVKAKYGEGTYTEEVVSDGIKYLETSANSLKIYKKENGILISKKTWSNTGTPVDKIIYSEWDEDQEAISYEWGIKKGTEEDIIILSEDYQSTTGNSINVNLESKLGTGYEGEITVFYRYKYNEEQYSDVVKYEIWIDDTNPNVNLVIVKDLRADLIEDIAWTNGEDTNNIVKYEFTDNATDGLSGISSYEYRLTGGSITMNWEITSPVVIHQKSGLSLEEASSPTGIPIYYNEVRVTDNAGNESLIQSNGFRFDKTKPDVSSVELKDLRSDLTEDIAWTNGEETNDTVKYEFTDNAIDELSGISSYEYRLTGGSIIIDWEITSPVVIHQKSGLSLEEANSPTGTPIYYNEVRVTDNAGNESLIQSNGFRVDKTAPIINNIYIKDDDQVYIGGEPNKYYFNGENVNLYINLSEELSGVERIEYDESNLLTESVTKDNIIGTIEVPIEVDTFLAGKVEGDKIIYAKLYDRAGNESLIKRSDDFGRILVYDVTKPQFSDMGNGLVGYESLQNDIIFLQSGIDGTTQGAFTITGYKNYNENAEENPIINFIFDVSDNLTLSGDLKLEVTTTSGDIKTKEYDDSFGLFDTNKESLKVEIGGNDITLTFMLIDKSGNSVVKEYEHIIITNTPRLIDVYIEIYGKKRHIKYIEDIDAGELKKYYFDSD